LAQTSKRNRKTSVKLPVSCGEADKGDIEKNVFEKEGEKNYIEKDSE
jgi:hypothetical protein